ncbi:hypothetical protein, partial [[Ruminococcus] torques]|uniref:hypothetical protein n=1 Tax=[Ruminococcus] torques TaxID=33039 RepID=UPI003AB336EE
YLRNWQVTFLLYTLGVFISEYTAKAFTEPRDYRVVFLIQKLPAGITCRQKNLYFTNFIFSVLKINHFSISKNIF